jgi:hypothetical protein
MPRTTPRDDAAKPTDPPTLLAILIGARRVGDRMLETIIRRELESEHRIKVCFLAEQKEAAPCA